MEWRRRKQITLVGWAAFALVVSCSVPSSGAIMNYLFYGTGTGNVDNTNFVNAEFTITLTGNTDDIVEFSPGVLDIEGPTTILLENIGMGSFLIPTRVFSNTTISTVGFSRARSIGGADLVNLRDNAFAGYLLDVPLGPIVQPNPTAVNQFQDVTLDIGLLSFSEIEIVTFEAIPEPGTVCLLGLGGLLLSKRRREQ